MDDQRRGSFYLVLSRFYVHYDRSVVHDSTERKAEVAVVLIGDARLR